VSQFHFCTGVRYRLIAEISTFPPRPGRRDDPPLKIARRRCARIRIRTSTDSRKKWQRAASATPGIGRTRSCRHDAAGAIMIHSNLTDAMTIYGDLVEGLHWLNGYAGNIISISAHRCAPMTTLVHLALARSANDRTQTMAEAYRDYQQKAAETLNEIVQIFTVHMDAICFLQTAEDDWQQITEENRIPPFHDRVQIKIKRR
jgi:hypothetical protein